MKVSEAFYPVCEKHVKSEVKLMSLAPKFDLLAVATIAGELLLYRLVSKEKVWGLPVPGAGVGILSVCWRPDGKLIAVSYDSAKQGIHFVAMEKPTRIRKSLLKKDVTATILTWDDVDCDDLPNASRFGEELKSEEYLPKIPLWEFESKEKAKNFRYLEKGKFNILLVCDSSCHITLLANGIFPIVKISCMAGSASGQVLTAAHMTSKMENLSVVRTCGKASHLQMYNLKSVATNVKLYEAASDEAYEILSLETYLSEILDTVSEQCEMVAQEMDSHLVSYLAKSASSDRIGDDFMQLLMWGKPTQALTDIFTNHMTKRGIKKLGTLIESSYTSIQQDLTLNFQNGVMNLYYHLTEMRGMVTDRKHVLPFSAEDADELISMAGSLLLKTAELLHVIDTSLKNFKAFFRWLYISMIKIQEETADKIGNVSMSEMAFVADFIHEHLSFRGQGEKKSRQFQLEKVYQYLKDEPLSSRMKSTQNEWLNFVSSSNILSSCKSMIQPYPELSLRQIFKTLSAQLDKIVRFPKFSQNHDINLLKSVQLSDIAHNEVPKAQFWTKTTTGDVSKDGDDVSAKHETYLLYKEKDGPCKKATLLSLNSDASSPSAITAVQIHAYHLKDDSIVGKEGEKELMICDFAIYDENTVTCLFQYEKADRNCNLLAQVDLTNVINSLYADGASPQLASSNQLHYSGTCIPSIDISENCVAVRDLGKKVIFVSVAVCGGRKVSCVLSSDHHTIQPFLLDANEEEDESVLDTDKEE